MIKNVIHNISLKGIGGVQQAFLSYYNYACINSEFNHKIFSKHSIDKEYGKFNNFYKLKKNYIKYIYYLVSKNSIIHFHNNIAGKNTNRLLSVLPSNNIVFHEHGTAWNIQSESEILTYRKNAHLAKKIIVNSQATRNYLINKFQVNSQKIELAYYGFKIPTKLDVYNEIKSSKKIKVGYIGRFDTFKGVHTLVDAAIKLNDSNIEFFVAGDGIMREYLKEKASKSKNIHFLGRVSEPLKFVNSIDILVVPSIREPLGIVNIEAGICKKPVIGSNIDGIPEVIQNKKSGILIKPSKEISFDTSVFNSAPLPDYVICPDTLTLTSPKEIDSDKLAHYINELAYDKEKREFFGKNLHEHVKNKFSVESYFNRLEEIYKSVN